MDVNQPTGFSIGSPAGSSSRRALQVKRERRHGTKQKTSSSNEVEENIVDHECLTSAAHRATGHAYLVRVSVRAPFRWTGGC